MDSKVTMELLPEVLRAPVELFCRTRDAVAAIFDRPGNHRDRMRALSREGQAATSLLAAIHRAIALPAEVVP